jgi:hypothetical protein
MMRMIGVNKKAHNPRFQNIFSAIRMKEYAMIRRISVSKRAPTHMVQKVLFLGLVRKSQHEANRSYLVPS